MYEVKLRPDVVWHDGKPFTADDVIYSLRQMGDPKHLGHFAVANIKLAELKKIDDLTVQIPLKSPNARLVGLVRATGTTVIVQDGETDFTQAGRHGAVQVRQSFTLGERSLCAREPELLGGGQAVRRRVGGHLDRRQRGAPERAARAARST